MKYESDLEELATKVSLYLTVQTVPHWWLTYGKSERELEEEADSRWRSFLKKHGFVHWPPYRGHLPGGRARVIEAIGATEAKT